MIYTSPSTSLICESPVIKEEVDTKEEATTKAVSHPKRRWHRRLWSWKVRERTEKERVGTNAREEAKEEEFWWFSSHHISQLQ